MTDTSSDLSARPSNLTSIALVSAAMLLLELVLIRWVAAEVRVFAYMHNLLLVASFLGIALGCYRADRLPNWTRGLIALTVIALLVADPLRMNLGEMVTRGIAGIEESGVWDSSLEGGLAQRVNVTLGALVVTLVIVAGTAMALEPYGQLLGALMQQYPRPIAAYSANLVGSLAGTWGFFLLSALSTGPVCWFAVASVLTALLILISSTHRALHALLLLIPWGIVLSEAARVPAGTEVIWSPYQKLVVSSIGKDVGYAMRVNNTFYQAILNLSKEARRARPELFEDNDFNHYDLPYLVLPPVKKVLIVGAGTGNDVAAALRHHAQDIDAVEIDPRILEIGVRLHPEKPYQDAAVQRVVDDARSYFKRAPAGSYDLVWFGLLDSHTTGSGYTTLRLDHYVYTRESFLEARRLLRPGGVIVCAFQTGARFWLGDRIQGLLQSAFDGVPPLSLRISGAGLRPDDDSAEILDEVFFAGDTEALANVRAAFQRNPAFAEYLTKYQTTHDGGSIRLTDDDWPYLYLRAPRIPVVYLLVSVTLLLVLFRLRRSMNIESRMSWSFFFMGAAFLLIEVLGVSRAALLFGATWVVTAVVISGVLLMALLANAWVARSPGTSLLAPLVGVLLGGAALVLTPLDTFVSLPAPWKMLVAGSFFALPIFFSGILFTRLFQRTRRKDMALGSNLFGAIAGGLCEQFSFVSGLRALTAMAVILYLAAYFCSRQEDMVET